jgi:pyruvate/2-oxoglutarate dehydrogenase complex dihydrolipoamide acyltransferase (E2) component
MGNSAGSYQICKKNPFFTANVSINEYENRQLVGFTFFTEVDLTAIERLRSQHSPKPSYTAFVTQAVARALAEHPECNGRVFRTASSAFLAPRRVLFHGSAVAVAVERSGDGMESIAFIDVIRDAATRDVQEISDWLRRLATADVDTNQQWREFSETIRRAPSWLAKWLIRLPCFFPSLWVKYRGGGALISSPAKYGIDAVGGTWPWTLGFSFGLVKRRPVVLGDEIVARPTFTLTLTFDRRFIAGAQAAQLYRRVIELLESPQTEPESAQQDDATGTIATGPGIDT